MIFPYKSIASRIEWKGKNATPRVLNLPLDPSDRLPTLHELIFSGNPNVYMFDREHCQLLRQCMDWSQLRCLDLGISCPLHFFEEFGGSLPKLESLTMGIRTSIRKLPSSNQPSGPPACDDSRIAARFIESVPGLKELHITDCDPRLGVFASAVLTSQKSLQVLSYWAINTLQGAWTMANIMDLCLSCPDLSSLHFEISLENGKWVNRRSQPLYLMEVILICSQARRSCQHALLFQPPQKLEDFH